MLSSIHPLGEQARGNKYRTTAIAFVVGSVLGSVVTGVLVGSVGFAIRALFAVSEVQLLGVVAIVGLVALAIDLRGWAIPSLRRQVNEDWIGEFRGWVYGFGFGLQLGAGVTTFITSTWVMVWLAAILLSGSLLASVTIAAAFGLSRGLSIFATRSINSPTKLVHFHRRLAATAPAVRTAGTLALVTSSATAAALSTGLISTGLIN